LALRMQDVVNDRRYAIDMAFAAASQQICAYGRFGQFTWFDGMSRSMHQFVW